MSGLTWSQNEKFGIGYVNPFLQDDFFMRPPVLQCQMACTVRRLVRCKESVKNPSSAWFCIMVSHESIAILAPGCSMGWNIWHSRSTMIVGGALLVGSTKWEPPRNICGKLGKRRRSMVSSESTGRFGSWILAGSSNHAWQKSCSTTKASVLS